jgi:hypothetical protein
MATALSEKKIYTYEDINSLPEGNYEIIDGVRYDMSPTMFEHGKFEGIFMSCYENMSVTKVTLQLEKWVY